MEHNNNNNSDKAQQTNYTTDTLGKKEKKKKKPLSLIKKKKLSFKKVFKLPNVIMTSEVMLKQFFLRVKIRQNLNPAD